jgi:flagellar basal body-associated protein FliL
MIERDRGSRSGGGGLANFLALIAALMVLVIVAGSIYGLASGSRQRKLQREATAQAGHPGAAVFDKIGTLRASTADKTPAVVVATIAFPYDGSDRAFEEELTRKAASFKAAAIAYFSKKKADELAPAYEGGVKAALRDSFNGLLSLGKVGEIWLSDFAVVR